MLAAVREGLPQTHPAQAPSAAVIRWLVLCAALAVGVLAAGLAFNQSWATSLWPWADGPLSHLFVASIWAAIAAIAVGIAAVGELAELLTGGLALAVMFAGQSLYLFVRAGEGHGARYAVGYGAVAAVGLALAGLGSRYLPVRDQRPMPRVVRVFFGLAVLLLLTAAILLLCRAQVFPWAVDPRSAAMFGCIALGSASYFSMSMLKPRWQDARGGAIALLAYDIALLPTYVRLPSSNDNPYATTGPINNVHLAIYLTFLSVTALFSIYYLLVARGTRDWRVQAGDELPVAPTGSSANELPSPGLHNREGAPVTGV